MRATGRAGRWQGRKIARLAVIGVVLAVTGVTAGAGATTSQRTATISKVSLAYTCVFPSGRQPVSVVAGAAFPSAGVAHQPIQPADAGVTVTLPHPAVADLTQLHATTIAATTRLTTEATQHGRSAAVAWPGLTARPTSLPAEGSLSFTASGVAPPVTVAVPGDVTFTAANLTLAFAPRHADGTAVRPAGLGVRCTLSPGQDATLAMVPVAGAAGAPASGRPAGSSSRMSAVPANKNCPPLPQALKLNPRFPLPAPPPGTFIAHAPGIPAYCTYATGFSDVRKLNGASLVRPGLTNLSPFLNSFFNTKPPHNYFQQDSAGELSYHGLRQFPPSKATFLGFGFIPTSAVMQLTEIGTVNVATVGPDAPGLCHGPCPPTITHVSSRMFVRIYGVTVNGSPLNVGPHCQTAPFNVVLTGSSDSKPPYLGLTTGGPLTGTVEIPQFSGCGVGENLDPLFTASISGPGNFVKLTQGAVCESGKNPPFPCPPEIPKPLR
jgi:hypothetical protein